VHHLTHGIHVWLCGIHRTDTYLRRQGGATFTRRLRAAWNAAGVGGARREAALRAHRRRVHAPGAESLPGSYAWPHLRREAERRFAAGEAPDAVITDLRRRHRDDHATAPSIRSMRRWFAQGRWLTPATTNPPLRFPRPTRPLPQLPHGMMQDPLFPLSLWWPDERRTMRRGP
jgi:hypothetical protein